MSYFEDASLVLIPSAQKTSKVYSIKPTDGTGDLTFTRSNDTATRVGPDGLIQKVRTNVLLQSNTFSTTWTNSSTTETSGQAGYDGTNNAWLLDSTAGYIQQTISLNGLYTFSVYAKKGTAEGLRLRFTAGSNANCYINLNDGTEIIAHSGIYLSVVSVGSGWYRIGLAINDSAITGVRFFPIDLAGTNTTGNLYIQNSQVETGDIATDYIATTTAAVSVGPVANVPRLDYLNSSCPRLLLEPQRTNLKLYSEDFSTAAGYGASTSGSNTVTFTANHGTSPDGYQNADRLQLVTIGGGYADWVSANSISIGTTYTYSVYVKSLSGSASFYFLGGAFGNILKTATTEWTRLTYTFTATDTACYPRFLLQSVSSPTADLLVWGAQLEAGAYATSYIPTLGATVTRGADACYKTGISSLIGQTEGVVFYDFVWNGATTSTADYPIVLSGSDFNNFIGLNTTFNSNQLLAYSGGSAVASIGGADFVIGQRYKIALAYKANDFVYYVNGTLQGSDTSGAVPIGLANLQMVTPFGSKSTVQNANSILFFKTRLSNADLATLTTI